MSPSGPPSKAENDAHAAERVVYGDGSEAVLTRDGSGWSLSIDGVRQAHVGDPAAPPALTSVRWMLAALGQVLPARSAHLGGSLLTLPRAIAARRRDAQQVVIELDPMLVELVRSRFGVPAGVRLEVGDARAWLDAPTEGDLDAVVLDIFTGNRIPPPFTSRECFAAAREVLTDEGVLVINSVAGPEMEFTRRELATLREQFAHVGMIIQGSVLHGARFGNATLIASAAALDVAGIEAALSGDASKGVLLTDLDEIVGEAPPVTDDDELWSPVPPQPANVDQAMRMIEMLRSAVQEMKPPS
ncbi:spermidine synthase [Ruania halotolerans]|uniref:spermidine synthase n=1 Tax=Ruania halotolerans TaxID=2897773 RepID=UPI001E5B183E|nr:fused MFS/spermidine synthase [Ruania halotolerans]UFU07083.1 fused MFS/spermidine synthase [Ruania halotolerans]